MQHMAHSYNKWPNGIEEDCDVSLTQSRYNSNGMNIKGKSPILLDVWTPLSWSGSRRPQSCTPPSYRSTWQVCGCPSSPSPEVLGQFYLTATDSGPVQSKQCVIKAVSAETVTISVCGGASSMLHNTLHKRSVITHIMNLMKVWWASVCDLVFHLVT